MPVHPGSAVRRGEPGQPLSRECGAFRLVAVIQRGPEGPETSAEDPQEAGECAPTTLGCAASCSGRHKGREPTVAPGCWFTLQNKISRAVNQPPVHTAQSPFTTTEPHFCSEAFEGKLETQCLHTS